MVETAGVAARRGPVWAAQLFVLSMVIPIDLSVGGLLLTPHRLLLMMLFVPFFFRLFVFRNCGPVLAVDWLMLLGAFWAVPAVISNNGFAAGIEPVGVFILEFFGAYLLARVAIRSVEDFQSVVRLFFVLVVILLPFAVAESITRRPLLLQLLPGTSVVPVDAGIRFGLRRAQTVFPHPILFGIFVSTGLGLFWYALRPRWLRFPASLLVLLGTFVSLSTGALISFVFQSIFIFWEMILNAFRRRWTLFAALAVAGYIAVDLLSTRTPFHVLVTYATFSTGSAYSRILIWQYGTENVWANPIFGIGYNDWARPSWMGSSVDNFWLLIGMRYGLPSITMIIAALVILLRRVARLDLSDQQDRRAQAAYLVVFGGLCIAGGTVHYWHNMMAFVLFIFGSGVWLITDGTRHEAEQDDTTPASDTRPRRVRLTRQPAPGVPIGRTSRSANQYRRQD